MDDWEVGITVRDWSGNSTIHSIVNSHYGTVWDLVMKSVFDSVENTVLSSIWEGIDG